jgi:hypothetical protein
VPSLMELEMEMGFRSSFNFIPEGSYRVLRLCVRRWCKTALKLGSMIWHTTDDSFDQRAASEGMRSKLIAISRNGTPSVFVPRSCSTT